MTSHREKRQIHSSCSIFNSGACWLSPRGNVFFLFMSNWAFEWLHSGAIEKNNHVNLLFGFRKHAAEVTIVYWVPPTNCKCASAKQMSDELSESLKNKMHPVDLFQFFHLVVDATSTFCRKSGCGWTRTKGIMNAELDNACKSNASLKCKINDFIHSITSPPPCAPLPHLTMTWPANCSEINLKLSEK